MATGASRLKPAHRAGGSPLQRAWVLKAGIDSPPGGRALGAGWEPPQLVPHWFRLMLLGDSRAAHCVRTGSA